MNQIGSFSQVRFKVKNRPSIFLSNLQTKKIKAHVSTPPVTLAKLMPNIWETRNICLAIESFCSLSKTCNLVTTFRLELQAEGGFDTSWNHKFLWNITGWWFFTNPSEKYANVKMGEIFLEKGVNISFIRTALGVGQCLLLLKKQKVSIWFRMFPYFPTST